MKVKDLIQALSNQNPENFVYFLEPGDDGFQLVRAVTSDEIAPDDQATVLLATAAK